MMGGCKHAQSTNLHKETLKIIKNRQNRRGGGFRLGGGSKYHCFTPNLEECDEITRFFCCVFVLFE